MDGYEGQTTHANTPTQKAEKKNKQTKAGRWTAKEN